MTNISAEISLILSSNRSEEFFVSIGSTWLNNIFSAFVLPTLVGVAFVLNCVCLWFFVKIKVCHPLLYNYLIATTVINSLQCVVYFPTFYTYSARYFIYDYFAWIPTFYRCIVVNYVMTTLCFVVSIFDLFILVERLCVFNVNFKKIMRFSTKTNILITFILCPIINLPFFFMKRMRSESEFAESIASNLQTSGSQWMMMCEKPNSLMRSAFGKVLIGSEMLVKDVSTLVFEIYGSVLLLVYFKRFLAFKQNVSTLRDASSIINGTYCMPRNNKKLTHMVIILSIFSIAMHTTIVVYFVHSFACFSSRNQSNLIDVGIIFAMQTLVSLRMIINFFAYLHFDNNFKRCFKNLFGRNN